jgi:hypothetical protein
MSFTPIKDVNLEIMSKMDDRTLLNVCLTNNYAKELCDDQSFWHNRFVKKYGEEADKTKPQKRSWKNHYLIVLKDNDIFKMHYYEPDEILQGVTWDPRGINYSFIRMWTGNSPLNKQTEQFMNRFYLMDLGPYYHHKTAFQVLSEKAKVSGIEVNGTDIYYDRVRNMPHYEF